MFAFHYDLIFRITNVRLEHGGKYTCGPTTGIPDTVMVHVIAGNKYILS